MDKKIVRATIGPFPKDMFDLRLPKVVVMLQDSKGEISSEELFDFYPDEIQFAESELIGLTRKEAFELKRQKDEDWLRS